MESQHSDLESTHAVYHRILQPAYERMIRQNVYRNKINLKSGASAQLLHKRPKTTGYLAKRHENSSYPAASTYWNPSANESWIWNQSFAPSSAPSVGPMQDAPRAMTSPLRTDEHNMKTSSRANTFSATTRVREVPVNGIYKKEIQEFRSRTPSARGVRASAITNRSIVASQSAKASSVRPKTTNPSQQSSRWEREHAQLELTRERKRRSQVSCHRVDRMYYMLGSPSKIHEKYNISEDDLDKLRAIAISRGMNVPPVSSFPHRRPSSTSGPYSTPRKPGDVEEDLVGRQGSAKTIIPTADNMSMAGELSVDVIEATKSWKEDRSTSDHEDDEIGVEEVNSHYQPSKGKLSETPKDAENDDHKSVKSDSAILQADGDLQSVTFLTEKQVE